MFGFLTNIFLHRVGYIAITHKHYQELENRVDFFPLNYINAARLLYLNKLLEMTKDVPGDVVECGVGHGRSFLTLADIIRVTNSPKNIWGFDSFEGFPAPTAEDASNRNIKEKQYAVDEKTMWKRLYTYLNDDVFIRQRVTLIKGYFNETLDKYNGKISLLNLDVDLYQSYKVCLDKLYPKVALGGIITFDEYLRESIFLPGAMKAIDEFFADKKDRFIKDTIFGKYYIIKGAF